MDDLATLKDQRARLLEIQGKGVKAYEISGRRMEYKSGAEITAAIKDIERRIAALEAQPITMVRFATSKGI